MSCIELKGRELETQIISEAIVYAIVPEGEPIEGFRVRALWDTGATHCQVTPELAKKMGLKSLGRMDSNNAAGKTPTEIYELGMVIGEKIHYPKLYFGVSQGHERFDIVIGMNAIKYGRFTLNGHGDERTFRFEVP
jgi:predicted aspartyl protease